MCLVCNFNKVKYNIYFLLECIAYTKIRFHFKNICDTTNIYNVLIYENPSNLINLDCKLFEVGSNIIKQNISLF